MKAQKTMLSLIVMLVVSILGAINANATIWYVRDGGGTATQCTGKTNAVYPGSGSSQPCAFNHPAWVTGAGYSYPGQATSPLWVSGDTMYIGGDSDITPGAQAQYMIGYGMPNTAYCSTSYGYACYLNNVPAGISSSQPTSIIGIGTHQPQLWGTQRVQQVLSANNNYITLQNLELTDHEACAFNDPSGGCQYGGSYPYGAWAEDGLAMSGTGFVLNNLYIHGFGRYGINTGNLGNATFNSVWVIGNGFGGITVGNGGTTSVTGTLTFNQPIVEWNGCVEAYPVVGGVDNPSNYTNCFGQVSGGYGDGLAFGSTGNQNAGNWTVIGPGSISFNTQDGLDVLHGNANGTIQVDKMRFEGNAGQQVKVNSIDFSLTNSVVIGDCGWWYGAPQSLHGGMQNGDSCRAEGNAIIFNVTNSSITKIYNNTILSNGDLVLGSMDQNSTGCNSNTKIYLENNIVLGGYQWSQDSSFISGGQNYLTTYTYNNGNDGNGSGTCGNLTWDEDYNIVDGTKNNDQGCLGAHDKCDTNPDFISAIPMGTSGGAANTYYQGNAAASLVSLSSSSPAIAAGIGGLTYWNNGSDYHNVTRTSPPSIGGLEKNSCAVDAYGCVFNSDCCTGSCSNFVCGTSSKTAQPVVTITSPASGSGFTAGTNVAITVTASEAGGTISKIYLYDGEGVLLGASSTSPYTYIATDIIEGNYTFTAKATDASGISVISKPVAVTVTFTAASLLPSLPIAAISSPGGSTFIAGSNVTISATASEVNGTISKISIYNGSGVLLGSSSTSPFNYVAADLLAGTYTFISQATDVNGVSVTSSPVTVTVTTPTPSLPVVDISSPGGTTFTAGSNVIIFTLASETNGAISSISLYNGSGVLLGSSSASFYNYIAMDLPAGTYTYTAKATDVKGVSVTSSSITITVGASSPVVSLTSPVNGSTFTTGANITLTASASETNGTISKVMFYNGSTLLATVLSSPYVYAWSKVAAGNYSLTAIAYDTNAHTTTSTAVAVKVTGLPVVSLTSNKTSFTAPASIVMTATASEANGTISKVMFYNGSTLLATALSSPYVYTWNNAVAGNYSLTAVAYDTNAHTTTSTAVAVSVSGLPVAAITSPANGSTMSVGSNVTITAAASEANGSIAKVSFYYNGTNLLGSRTPAPFSYTVTDAPTGVYALTVVATDAKGVTVSSSSVSVTVK